MPNNNPLGNTIAPYLVFETFLNNQVQVIMLDDVVLEEIINTAPITITKAANGLVNNSINNPITASIGSVVNYTITVTTNGAACGTNITNLNLIDTVPAGLQYISASGLTPTTNISTTGIATTVLTANIPSVQPYSALTFSYAAVVVGTNTNQCQGNANLIIPNTATVRASFNSSVVTASSTVRIRVNQRNTNTCDVAPITLDFSQAIAQGLLRSPSSPNYNTAQNVVVNGTWILTGVYRFAPGSIITMKAGAQIIVAPQSILELDGAIMEGCGCMWYRIYADKSSQLIIKNSRISDAQYAVEMPNSNGIVTVQNTIFNNNFVGLYIARNTSPQISPLNNTSFSGNTFRSNSLIRPFNGISATPLAAASSTPVLGSIGLAGIYFSNVSTPFISNNFNQYRNLTAGILLFDVLNAEITNSTFRDITTVPNYGWEGTAIHFQSPIFPVGAAPLYSLKVSQNTITVASNGVVGLRCNIDVNNNRMRSINTDGVRISGNRNCQVSVNNNNIQAAGRGVNMQLMNALNTTVANNIITVNTPFSQGGGTTAGVFYTDNANLNALTIINNEITCDSANARMGIYVQGNQKGNVASNTIVLNGGRPRFGGDRVAAVGIASSIFMNCNQVNPVATSRNDNRTNINIAAFLSNNSILRNSIQCNVMNNTYAGIQIEGSGLADIRGNYIKNHMNGLWYKNTATNVGVQTNAGNLFISNNLPAGGVEGRNDAPFAANQYFYNANAANAVDLLPSPIFVPLTSPSPYIWFNANSGIDYNCNAQPVACNFTLQRIANPNINTTDMNVASGTYSPISNWDLHSNKRGLYKKIKQDATISQTMPIMQQFETAEQNTPVGLFDLVATQTEAALKLNSTDSTTLSNCQTQIQLLTDSIRVLDSLANDTARLHALQNQLIILVELCDSTAQVIQTAKNAILDNTALITNAAINPVLDHETAEKLVNEIYLNTIAKGTDEFSPAQIQTLQLVSAQCPDIVGISVYQARAMYDLVADVDMLSKAGCNNGNNLEMQPTNIENTAVEITNQVVLYPNPTSTEINLHTTTALAAGTKIAIYNNLGQVVQTQIIANEVNFVSINVQSLPNGTYTLQVSSEANPIVKSFVVIRQ